MQARSLGTARTANKVTTASDVLETHAFFKDCHPGFLDNLANQLDKRFVLPGELVCRQGEPWDRMIFLMHGEARAPQVQYDVFRT